MKGAAARKQAMIKPHAFSNEPNAVIAAATTMAETTVIGPVGPLIWEGVPPKNAAMMPNAKAP